MTVERQAASVKGGSVFDTCNELVESTMGKPNDILFFPFLLDGPRGAPAGFTGMTVTTGMADMLRAIYEGVTCIHRHDMSALLTGPDAAKPDVIRFAGGPSRSAVWAQMFADCMGLPLEITNGSELGAKGAAMCGAVASGAYASMSEAMRGMVKLERRFEPDTGRGAILAAKYQRFCNAINMNVKAWQESRVAP
jgi:L-xylulokinase